MVIDLLSQAAEYRTLGDRIAAAIRFVTDGKLATLAEGRHELSDGAFALVMNYITEPARERQFEAHRSYIDLQCVVSGKETIYWTPVSYLSSAGAYDENRDIVFFEDGEASSLHMTAGHFAIFFPADAHKPNCLAGPHPEAVKKVVVKIPYVEP